MSNKQATVAANADITCTSQKDFAVYQVAMSYAIQWNQRKLRKAIKEGARAIEIAHYEERIAMFEAQKAKVYAAVEVE